jgi:hypothetical protein
MKRISSIITIASLLLGGATLASTEAVNRETFNTELYEAPEPIDSFNFFGHFDSWKSVDRDTLIVWTTARKPYLIELRRPSPELLFAHSIAITSIVGMVHSRLDNVYVEGRPYGIEAIYRLTPEQARNWKRQYVGEVPTRDR